MPICMRLCVSFSWLGAYSKLWLYVVTHQLEESRRLLFTADSDMKESDEEADPLVPQHERLSMYGPCRNGRI
jgi:hypothetical protein